MGKSSFSGPMKSTAGFIQGADSLVSLTAATVTFNEDDHSGRTLLLDRAAGVTATLPAATGTGNKYRAVIKTTVTSNGYIVKVANATDVMIGMATLAQDAADTSVMFETASTSDTLTLNGTTTGGIAGGVIEVEDIAAGIWLIHARSAATGTEATPFSATVS